jgi:hypothetical protein
LVKVHLRNILKALLLVLEIGESSHTHMQHKLVVAKIGPLAIVNVCDQVIGGLASLQGLVLKQKEVGRHELEIVEGEKVTKGIDDVPVGLDEPS